MDTLVHPGKGLSLSQLVFALNEELKHAVHSPSYVARGCGLMGGWHTDFLYSFTFSEICQLDRDASTVLATIREWRDSFVPINRIPLEVLSLVPTHIPAQKDRFRATFVCRRWRRTFLQHAALWSQLYLRKGEVYVKRLLERAQGTALDIFASSVDDVSAMMLLPPHIKRIRFLDFADNQWVDIRMFSALYYGSLPLLRALNINAVGIGRGDPGRPPLPLFSNAVNLQEFRLHSKMSPPLDHFAFPNLTFFELSVAPVEEFRASQLLDFLEASPMLQAVRVKIDGDILLDDVPQERIVVLPNLESLCLIFGDGGPGYGLAAHISCPSAKHTSLTHEGGAGLMTPQKIFPDSAPWSAIVRQHTRSPIEEVTLEMRAPLNSVIACSLTFRSPDATVIRLHFEIVAIDEGEGANWSEIYFEAIYHKVFYQASRTIQDLPLLDDVKRLCIRHSGPIPRFIEIVLITDQVWRLFESVGPLEELIFYHCDMRPYLAPFLDYPEFRHVDKPAAFPQIKELTILHPLCPPREDFEAAIVELAESQHALGVPLERVTVRMDHLSAEMAGKLRLWVGIADCYDES